MHNWLYRAVGGALAVAMAAGSAAAADKLTFVRSAPWALDSAQLTFAQELGFFDEENLSIDYVVAQGSLAAVQQILGGSGQMGYLSPEVIAISHQEGKSPIPMKLVYNYYRRTIWEIVVTEDSPIKEMADLKGKTIGVGALTSGNAPITTAALASIGFAPTDYSFVPVGFGAQAFQALTSKSVDALNLFHTMHETLATSGVKIRRIAYPDNYASVPSSAIAFSQSYIDANPSIVERFGRALTKGTIACAANREACVQSLWKAYPETKPSTPEAEAMTAALSILDVNLKLLLPTEGEAADSYGEFIEAPVKTLLEAVKVGGLITNADIPMDTIYTNQFVKAYNDFDFAKVEEAARNAK